MEDFCLQDSLNPQVALPALPAFPPSAIFPSHIRPLIDVSAIILSLHEAVMKPEHLLTHIYIHNKLVSLTSFPSSLKIAKYQTTCQSR